MQLVEPVHDRTLVEIHREKEKNVKQYENSLGKRRNERERGHREVSREYAFIYFTLSARGRPCGKAHLVGPGNDWKHEQSRIVN